MSEQTTVNITHGSNVVDLENDYLKGYLIDVRKRAPTTIDLYRRSIAACKLTTVKKDEIDQVWANLRALLESGAVGKIFVDKARTVVKGAIKRKAWAWQKTEDYQRILELTSIEGEEVEEYRPEDIQTILGVTYKEPDLFNACTLMSLSGLRAGALKGIRWNDFHKVEGVEGVLLFQVYSKRKHYVAAISERVINYLEKYNIAHKHNSDSLVYYDPGFATPFTTLLRTKLYYHLVIKYGLKDALELERKSMLHSMRHFALTEFAASLPEHDAAILSGHKVSYGTTNRYVNKISKRRGGMPLPDYRKKIAELYKQTPLYKFPIEEADRWSRKWRPVR
jgi:integrase